MKIRNNRLGSHFYCDNLIEGSGKESLKEIHLQEKDRRARTEIPGAEQADHHSETAD